MTWRVALVIVAAIHMSGCPPPQPSNGPITWPDGPPGYFKARWEQGQEPRTLVPAATSICGLSAVSGRFAGGREWVLVNVDSSGNWVLKGSSQQNSVSAEATCVSASAFLQPNGMQWTNGSWTRSFTAFNNICFGPAKPPDDIGDPGDEVPPLGGGGPVPYNCPVNDQATPLWSANSACYLTGFGGFHLASGESTSAEQFYKSGDPTWYLHNQGFDLGQLTWGGSACLAFSSLQATAPFVWPGMPVLYKPSHDWWYGGSGPLPPALRLANRNNAYCVLSRAGGGFFGGGESVSIQDIDSTGRQQLTGSSFQQGTRASAVCIYYNQINPPNPGIEPFQ
jgi:hypothetical protein